MRGIGLAIPTHQVKDHFVAALAHALADPLIRSGRGLFTKVVASAATEEQIYRHWAAREGVAAVALLDVRPHDPRLALLEELDLPFAGVVTGDDVGDFPAVVVDDRAWSATLEAFLAATPDRPTVRVRADGDRPVETALTALEHGRATLVCDQDLDAVAILTALTERGVAVPEQVAVVCLTDSLLCQVAAPSITAVNRRGSEIGDLLGHQVLAAVDGAAVERQPAPEPFLVVRESA